MNLAVSQAYLALVESMLLSQNKYIIPKIKDKGFKEGYNNRMQVFLAETKICHDFTVYNTYFERVELRFDEKVRNLGFFEKMLTKQQVEGERFANEIVKEILNSINTRFVEGGTKLYEALLDAEDYRDVKGNKKSGNAKCNDKINVRVK
jgi:hypothetical protein